MPVNCFAGSPRDFPEARVINHGRRSASLFNGMSLMLAECLDRIYNPFLDAEVLQLSSLSASQTSSAEETLGDPEKSELINLVQSEYSTNSELC